MFEKFGFEATKVGSVSLLTISLRDSPKRKRRINRLTDLQSAAPANKKTVRLGGFFLPSAFKIIFSS